LPLNGKYNITINITGYINSTINVDPTSLAKNC